MHKTRLFLSNKSIAQPPWVKTYPKQNQYFKKFCMQTQPHNADPNSEHYYIDLLWISHWLFNSCIIIPWLICQSKFFIQCSIAKATLESQMSVSLSQKPLSLRNKPINHQAYWPSSLLTIEPINLFWSSFATFKPFELLSISNVTFFKQVPNFHLLGTDPNFLFFE